MKEEKVKGKIVLTSSIMALMGFAGYASYSPSKYAIRGMSGPAPSFQMFSFVWRAVELIMFLIGAGLADSLRNELILYGISVHLFLPATIFSPGFENEQKLKPELCKKIEGPDEGKTPDQVALKLIEGAFASI